LEAERDACIAQPFTISLIPHPGHRDKRNYGPDHPLLLAAHQLAWITLRMIIDGYPLDAGRHTNAARQDLGRREAEQTMAISPVRAMAKDTPGIGSVAS
jgi:hypothetical protein